MDFTFESYQRMIQLLLNQGYHFTDYHNYECYEKCVILRHDIDQSLEKAVQIARIEEQLGVRSTWFILLTSDFYNAASKSSYKIIHEILEMGHDIGLHFDETVYPDNDLSLTDRVLSEAKMLSQIVEKEIQVVSMHRPSKKTISSDYAFPGIENAYSSVFMKDFKYLSDSHMRWREPIEELIMKGQFSKLHILTHAIWYEEKLGTIRDRIVGFMKRQIESCYGSLQNNISDFERIVSQDEVQRITEAID